MKSLSFSLAKRDVLLILGGLVIFVSAGIFLRSSRDQRQNRTGSDFQVLTQAITFNNLKLPVLEDAYLFNSQPEWSEFKTRYELSGLDLIDNLVDFSKESFVFINGGSFLTQGNFVSLAGYQKENNQLVLTVVIFEAGKNCPREHLLNYPTLGLKLKKFSGALKARFPRQSYECIGEGVEGILNFGSAANGKTRL